MQNIFGIKLTKLDYEYYQTTKKSFDVDNYLSFINKNAPLFKLQVVLSDEITALDIYREKITEFYEYSFERDEAFLNNMKLANLGSRVQGQGSRAGILITGGFHTENICDLLEDANISYVSILPQFTSEENYKNPYFDLLSGETANIQKMLTSVIAKASLMQIASKLSPVLGEAVWGNWGIDAFKAAVVIRAMVRRGLRVQVVDNKGDVVVDEGDENISPIVFDRRGLIDLVVNEEFIDTQIATAMRRGNFELVDDIAPSVREEVSKNLEAMMNTLMAMGKNDKDNAKQLRRAGAELFKIAAGLRKAGQVVIVDGVDGFNGHAGGRGIYINRKAVENDDGSLNVKRLTEILMHEAVAAYASDHSISHVVEKVYAEGMGIDDDGFFRSEEIPIKNLLVLAEESAMSTFPVWEAPEAERWETGRDIAIKWPWNKKITAKTLQGKLEKAKTQRDIEAIKDIIVETREAPPSDAVSVLMDLLRLNAPDVVQRAAIELKQYVGNQKLIAMP